MQNLAIRTRHCFSIEYIGQAVPQHEVARTSRPMRPGPRDEETENDSKSRMNARLDSLSVCDPVVRKFHKFIDQSSTDKSQIAIQESFG
jgi:hypothetical protein